MSLIPTKGMTLPLTMVVVANHKLYHHRVDCSTYQKPVHILCSALPCRQESIMTHPVWLASGGTGKAYSLPSALQMRLNKGDGYPHADR